MKRASDKITAALDAPGEANALEREVALGICRWIYPGGGCACGKSGKPACAVMLSAARSAITRTRSADRRRGAAGGVSAGRGGGSN